MPFTLSHAAAALPFRKLKPIWPALVMGTFAPDLQYFIWISDEDHSGHHFPGVVLLTLPLALSLLWIFERIVKRPVIELLPSGLQRRLQDKMEPLSFAGWGRFRSILLWMAVGILTHVVWDSFTHSQTWIVDRWTALSYWVPLPFPHPMTVVQLLQYASTLLGLLVLAIWLTAWYRRAAPRPSSNLLEFSPLVKAALICGMVNIASVGGYFYARLLLSGYQEPLSRSFLIATVFEAITFVFCIELVVYGLAFRLVSRTRRLPAPEFDETLR
jgi:membrane-bound metal-dependent hydrolase YbcI (DUF457 family)